MSSPASGVAPRSGVRRVLLAAPRGYCAGVERAIETVRKGLAEWGAPLYVRRQIVHNDQVVRDLERAGAVFVERVEDVPEGATVVFSAHGVAPSVERAAERRGLSVVDATCPLATKVLSEVRRHAERGYVVILVGHAGHNEVVATSGSRPRRSCSSRRSRTRSACGRRRRSGSRT